MASVYEICDSLAVCAIAQERSENKKRGYVVKRNLYIFWSERHDSNMRHPGPKPGALPSCATLRKCFVLSKTTYPGCIGEKVLICK